MHIDRRWAAVLVLGLGINAAVSAHSMDQAAILLDFNGSAINAELQLPLERLQLALGTQETSSVSATS